jgi:hypothetical protein
MDLQRQSFDGLMDTLFKPFSTSYIINFCLDRKIGTIVVGYNPTLKQSTNMGKRNNQLFLPILRADFAAIETYIYTPKPRLKGERKKEWERGIGLATNLR